ncbi:MAG: SEC-C domain-containing protein [Deltaproteobacteria bacterium]|nr:SEC-C domain-containing protein [Deltaproteobacteria bacterium]
MDKIGRNDPCPCGSGKKFKRCHLGKEDQLTTQETPSGEFSSEDSARITGLPEVSYGRSQEMLDTLDIKKLTGSSAGVRFIDLAAYKNLDLADARPSETEGTGAGGILINIFKTKITDPDHLYLAISPEISDSTLIHQLAHVLDYLGGSKLMPGVAKPLSFDVGIPTEHLEHPHEYAYWLNYLKNEFDVQLDADDTIVAFLYENDMLIKGRDIEQQDKTLLRAKSERMMRFMSEKSAEIDTLICERPGYIGSRVSQE